MNNENGGYREIEFDAITEKHALYFSYPLNDRFEFFSEISLNSASSNGSQNPMNWMVRDAFIERVHDIAGKSDIYDRRKKGFDNYKYTSIDENNNSFEIAQNEIFLIPLLIGTNYYWTFKQDKKKVISGNATFSLKIPLKSSSAYKTIETGLGASVNRTKRFRSNKSYTTSLHGSAYHYRPIENSRPIVGERKFGYRMTGLIGLNFISKKSNRYSIFTTLNKTSSSLNSEYYDVEGNRFNLQAYSAATKASEYFEVGANYAIHFKSKNILDIELTFREDINLSLNSMGTSLLGNNSEDFGIFIGFRYLLP